MNVKTGDILTFREMRRWFPTVSKVRVNMIVNGEPTEVMASPTKSDDWDPDTIGFVVYEDGVPISSGWSWSHYRENPKAYPEFEILEVWSSPGVS